MAAKFDYVDAQNTAIELVTYFGMDAVLRRKDSSPTDRPCRVAIVNSLARERPSDLTNPTDRQVILAPTPEILAMPPDNEKDELVLFLQPASDPPVEEPETYPFTSPVKVTAPAGIPAVFEFTVRR